MTKSSRLLISANYIFKNLFVPNVIVTILSGTLAYSLTMLYHLGVNLFFSFSLFFLSMISLIIIIVCLFVLIIIKKDRSIKFKNDTNRNIFFDLLLLLIPLTPIVNYLYNNKETLPINDMVMIFLFFIIFLLIFIVLVPIILKNFSPIINLRSVITGFFFTIFNMASVSGFFSWVETGNFIIQLGLFLISIIIIWSLLRLKKKGDILFLILVFFIGNSLLLILPQKNISTKPFVPSDSFYEEKLMNSLMGKQIQTVPNIYLLIYDAYAPDETLMNYGIDNSEQSSFLEENGFIIYPKTYSIGAYTLSTMNNVFNVSTNIHGHVRKGVAGDGIVQYILKENNYQTIGIFPSDYMFRTIGPMYDYYFPEKIVSPFNLLMTGVLMGEFRFDIGLKSINHDEFVKFKHDFFIQKGKEPFFIYSHSDLPNHSQTSGKCLENETDLFKNRLNEANYEMKQDISLILKNDPDAILIVAGDHGPYLTKNCTATRNSYDSSTISRVDIQDRYGTYLAIKWPTDDYKLYDQIVVLQDLFPSIFAFLYKDASILESKIEPTTIDEEYISGLQVMDGIIFGGIDGGEPLFLNGK